MTIMANSDFEKAEKLFQQNKLVEAKSLFEKHLKVNPNHTKTLEYLGDIAGKNKNWDEAIDYYKKVRNYELVCKVFGCSRSSLIRWVNQDKFNNNFFNKKKVRYGGYKIKKIHIGLY